MVVKRAIYALADSPGFTRWISDKGMRWGFARRFIAGERLDEVFPAVAELNRAGMMVTLDYLGESVEDVEATREAARAYCGILDEIDARDDIRASISMKLTQLGLDISTEVARENVETIVRRAAELDNFVRIDMESSDVTEETLQIFKALRPDFPNLGVCVQSYLYRTADDVRELNEMGAELRLCKGAYNEPPEVAWQEREKVDESFRELAELLLLEGHYPAFATHDDALIRHIQQFAEEHGIGKDAYEFQMLYGIRRDYQKEIVDAGYNLRIYVPFGTQWCPYFMRRIAERPANAWFVARAMIFG